MSIPYADSPSLRQLLALYGDILLSPNQQENKISDEEEDELEELAIMDRMMQYAEEVGCLS